MNKSQIENRIFSSKLSHPKSFPSILTWKPIVVFASTLFYSIRSIFFLFLILFLKKNRANTTVDQPEYARSWSRTGTCPDPFSFDPRYLFQEPPTTSFLKPFKFLFTRFFWIFYLEWCKCRPSVWWNFATRVFLWRILPEKIRIFK